MTSRPRPRGGPRLLVTDRSCAVLLERSKVRVDGGRVVYDAVDDAMVRTFAIPHVNVAVLFLGQGTSITQDAVRLLAEEHVHIAFVGSGGTPIHAGALTTYSSTDHFRRLIPVYLDPDRSAKAATRLMSTRLGTMRDVAPRIAKGVGGPLPGSLGEACARFERSLGSVTDTRTLLGYEGTFAKACYAAFGEWAGVKGFRRTPGEADEDAPDMVRAVNRLVDHGNYLAYGMAGAALWVLGIPPHMSVLHGKTRPGGLVFDVADAFKDAFVLPLAFAGAVGGGAPERLDVEFRGRLIDAMETERVLVIAIKAIEAMLGPRDA